MEMHRKMLCQVVILVAGILCTVQMGWAKPLMSVSVVSLKEIVETVSYIDNSATRADEVMFSIDGGKTFKKPSLLTYEIKLPGGKTEHYTARPEEYTHIRWIVKSVPAGAEGTVSFKVRVK